VLEAFLLCVPFDCCGFVFCALRAKKVWRQFCIVTVLTVLIYHDSERGGRRSIYHDETALNPTIDGSEYDSCSLVLRIRIY
jgi:hypothetical protein